MHLHFDPVGGVAGDMIVAALLDAFPEHTDAVMRAVTAVTAGDGEARVIAWRDHALGGRRFEVRVVRTTHEHVDLADIEGRIRAAALVPPVIAHALAIFRLLGDAEARVHGIAPERVAFHEVGALDSIADIVGAASVIAALGETRCTVGPLPIGSGRLESAHGTLPIPAPAVLELLGDLSVHDDGIGGERVTPTGAAILRHMNAASAPIPLARFLRHGHGFGTRRLPGLSNVLRLLVLAPLDTQDWTNDQVAVIGFEVDDQSLEDLALGLDRIRALDGVLDVMQTVAATKKNRIAVHVQVLARPEARDAAMRACFAETTTLGLRHALVERAVLPRSSTLEQTPFGLARVKTAVRPGGRRTAKVESDDLATLDGGRKQRETAKRRALATARGSDPHDN
jgi:uncharacterized protein (TIGR00299 family) protein